MSLRKHNAAGLSFVPILHVLVSVPLENPPIEIRKEKVPLKTPFLTPPGVFTSSIKQGFSNNIIILQKLAPGFLF